MSDQQSIAPFLSHVLSIYALILLCLWMHALFYTLHIKCIYAHLYADGGGGHASSFGLHLLQETPSFCRRGRRGGVEEELRISAQSRRLAVGWRAELLWRAWGGGATETVPALPHHGVPAEPTGCCSGWHRSAEGQKHICTHVSRKHKTRHQCKDITDVVSECLFRPVARANNSACRATAAFEAWPQAPMNKR